MLVLSEKLDVRTDLREKLSELLRELVGKASGGIVSVGRTTDGWMSVEADDEILVRSIIKLETFMNPVASGKPPYTAYVREVADDEIKIAYPTPSGKTVWKTMSTRRFAATLGYDDDEARRFLEGVGIFRGSMVSVAADAASALQLKLMRRMILKGLDVIFVMRAARQEVDHITQLPGISRLIADQQALTLSSHILYVKLGVSLYKVYEKVREAADAISKEIDLRPIPWIGPKQRYL